MPAATEELTVAEELRHAAALIRERADAATPGPWRHMCMGSDGCIVIRTTGTIREKMRGRIAQFGWKEWKADHADAVHVAGWDPPTAHAAADLLQLVAAQCAVRGGPDRTGYAAYALALARAYLDEGQS